MPLLCSACESLFNTYETPFATKVFHPFDKDQKICVGYSDWMLKFCVSVSWRVLRNAQDGGHLGDLTSDQRIAVNRALMIWSDFLKGARPHPGVHEQHVLPLGPIESHTFPDMPDNMNRYLLRTIDMDVPHGERTVLTYAKLGPFALFGYVRPPEERWEGSKIHVRRGTIEPREYVLPRMLYEFIADRARRVRAIYEEISDKQVAKIDAAAEQNLDTLAASKQFEAMMHDHRLFGEHAVVRKSRHLK